MTTKSTAVASEQEVDAVDDIVIDNAAAAAAYIDAQYNDPAVAPEPVLASIAPEVMDAFRAALARGPFPLELEDPQPEALTADGEMVGGGEWHSVLVYENRRTTDGRELAPNSLQSRALPLPMAYLTETTYSGHEKAKLGGRIDSVERDTAGRIIGRGVFARNANGAEFQSLVEQQMLRHVSIDPEVLEWELVLGGNEVDFFDIFFGDVDESQVTERWLDCRLLGATGCMFPAFEGALIMMRDQTLPSATDESVHGGHDIPLTVAASAAMSGMWWESDDRPPAAWFEHPDDPNRDGFVLTDSGRLYGYVAPEGLRHVGYTDRRVTVPRCADYDRFMVGVVKALNAEGIVQPIRTGPIVMGTGHAPGNADWRAATRHYDNTGAAVADIAVGEDDHGVWFAGCVRPCITAEQLYVLNATRRVSGDWRPIEQEGSPTELEMIGVLTVNAGGFPQKASVVAAAIQRWAPDTGRTAVGMSGDQVMSLVACMPPPGPVSELRQLRTEMAAMRSVVDVLRPLALERLAAMVAPK